MKLVMMREVLKKSENVAQKDLVKSREVSVNKKGQQSQKVSESKLIRRKNKTRYTRNRKKYRCYKKR